MTTTNRAFIKAYRQDEAQPAPAVPAIAAPGRQAAVEHAHAPGAERSAIYGPRPDAGLVRGAAEPLVAYRPGESPSAAASTTAPEEPRQPTAPSPGAKRPLSSFIAASGIARLSAGPAENDFLRPGTTLASFHWPAVCRALLRHSRDALGRIAELLVMHAAAGRSVVGVLGLGRGSGTTTLALCLAARLAERRRRVVLVDGNFGNPQLAARLDVEPTAGWQDVLKHGAPLSDAAIRAADDHLDLLALGPKVPGDHRKLVGGLQAVVTAGVLRHAYEHVLIDTGAFPDGEPVVSELVRNMGVDGVLAVAGPGPAAPGALATLAELLARSGCELLGTIENRVTGPLAA